MVGTRLRPRKLLRDKAGTTRDERGNSGCPAPHRGPLKGPRGGNNLAAALTLTDGETTTALRRLGVSEQAIGRWSGGRRQRDSTAPRVKPPQRSEASIQREIVNALKAAGWRVWRIGQRDARKTQDAGVPDLFAMRPWALGYGAALATWIECKRADGKQSEAQKDFERRCEHAGQRYVVARSLDDIRDLL